MNIDNSGIRDRVKAKLKDFRPLKPAERTLYKPQLQGADST